jgi:hypothetical protein
MGFRQSWYDHDTRSDNGDIFIGNERVIKSCSAIVQGITTANESTANENMTNESTANEGK